MEKQKIFSQNRILSQSQLSQFFGENRGFWRFQFISKYFILYIYYYIIIYNIHSIEKWKY